MPQTDSTMALSDSVGSKESFAELERMLRERDVVATERLAEVLKDVLRGREKGPAEATISEIRGTVGVFDGSSDVERWISVVERTAKQQGWENRKVEKVSLLLEGKARDFMEATELYKEEWDAFAKALKDRFRSRQARINVLSQMMSCKRAPRQDLRAYAQHLRKMAMSSDTPIEEDDIKKIFLRGLPEKFQTLAIFSDKLSMEELVSRCHDIDVMAPGSSEESHQGQGGRRNQGQQGNGGKNSRSQSATCEICGRANHKTEDCFFGPGGKYAGQSSKNTQPKADGTQQQQQSHHPRQGQGQRSPYMLRPRGKDGKAEIKCYICDGPHRMADCPNRERLNALMAEDQCEDKGDFTCFICGGNHRTADCPYRMRLRELLGGAQQETK